MPREHSDIKTQLADERVRLLHDTSGEVRDSRLGQEQGQQYFASR